MNKLNDDTHHWKTTSKYPNGFISTTTGNILPSFEIKAYVTKPKLTNSANEDNLQWKMTYNGRHPPIEEDLKMLDFPATTGLILPKEPGS